VGYDTGTITLWWPKLPDLSGATVVLCSEGCFGLSSVLKCREAFV